MTRDLDVLLPWYRQNRRDLPWRRRSDCYAIWVSEIMLQQTGVSTVIPYFEKWMERFPTVQDLAAANDQDVLELWQGLGYYRRCKNLLTGARRITSSGWPTSARDWQRVPGVGAYTAGAIVSIALGLPSAVVDGNVMRVYARLTGDDSSGAELQRHTWTWAEAEIRAEAPGDWNQALMELGATVCTASNPRCESCPLMDFCVARNAGRVAELPAQVARRPVVELSFQVHIRQFNGKFGVRQIPEGEWWAGMWEFPRTLLTEKLRQKPALKHTVTHHRISLFPIVEEVAKPAADLTWLTERQLLAKPMPAPQRRLLEKLLEKDLPSTQSLEI